MKARASDASDPLELLIVRDMWLTGFDSPPMHTMYVDKPMRSAGLMQAITRVNRTFKDKPSGLIVDYIGIAENLKDAPATYTDRDKQDRAIGERARRRHPRDADRALSDLLHDIDWVTILSTGDAKAFVYPVTATVDHLLQSEPGGDEIGEGGSAPRRALARPRRIRRGHSSAISSRSTCWNRLAKMTISANDGIKPSVSFAPES
jgi:type I restriction enzyme R subunit